MQLTYAQAINRALSEALEESDEVIVFGEDVAAAGGIFGVTKGLAKRYGARVFDTPISESAILGGAVGAALVGMRPVAEVMWADFLFVALDQVINQAANVRYGSRSKLTAPILIRTQQGTSPGACAQHSQSVEAMLAHVPGIYVCMPYTVQDAYSLTRTGIWLDDPVVSIENRSLYHGTRENVEPVDFESDFGKATVLRSGTDATLVSWGSTLGMVATAANRAAAEGIDCEVINLRWLRPLDIDCIVQSVQRTGRMIVAHEAHTFAGLGAEVVAEVIESGIRLKAPPVRLGLSAVRIPAAPSLLEAVMPNEEGLIGVLRKCVANDWSQEAVC